MEYNFILKYQLVADNRDLDRLVDRLSTVGCGDAKAEIGRVGRLTLEFTRSADNADSALRSVLASVRRALPSARLIEVAPDLVGLTDVAAVAGVSRQNMRKLMLAYPDSFPVPVHEGKALLWHLSDVLLWLREKGNYPLAPATLEVAQAALQINVAKEGHRLPSAVFKELKPLV